MAECAWDIQNLMVAVEGERRVERGGQSSPHAPHRATLAAPDRSSCSCFAGASIAGMAEKERRGMRSSGEGRVSVIKWGHHIRSKTRLSYLRTSGMQV